MKTIKISILSICLISVMMVEALNWMNSNYWYAGNMKIQCSNPHVMYKIYALDAISKKYKPLDVELPVNRFFAIKDLMGGFAKCPYFGEKETAMKEVFYILAPSVPYSSGVGQSKTQQSYDEAKSGYSFPYVIIYRKGSMLSIYILGPTNVALDYARKIVLNLNAFENSWVAKSNWYKTLKDHAKGMAFAFTFNADTGAFPYLPGGEYLANNALYITGISDLSKGIGFSWTIQGIDPKAKALDVDGMSLKKLQDQGILVFQGEGLDPEDLQWAIDCVNKNAGAKFANVLSGGKKR